MSIVKGVWRSQAVTYTVKVVIYRKCCKRVTLSLRTINRKWSFYMCYRTGQCHCRWPWSSDLQVIHTWQACLEWGFRVRIGNNGAMHFNAYPESYNHVHSVTGRLIMAALWNRAGHYIFIWWFLLLLSIFFPHLISAVADWMSAIQTNSH